MIINHPALLCSTLPSSFAFHLFTSVEEHLSRNDFSLGNVTSDGVAIYWSPQTLILKGVTSLHFRASSTDDAEQHSVAVEAKVNSGSQTIRQLNCSKLYRMDMTNKGKGRRTIFLGLFTTMPCGKPSICECTTKWISSWYLLRSRLRWYIRT